jgi:phosphocarrier protein HPr
MMQYREIEILNKLGLHARASARLTQLASQFQSEVWLSRNDRKVNAKSIMGVMMLAASKGVIVGIETAGADEAEAMQALVDLIGNRFGESE